MAVLAQRLVRKICKKCRTPFEPTESQLGQLNLSPHDIGDKSFYYGRGCPVCNDTGYKGRKGIYELLVITDAIRNLINERAPTVVHPAEGGRAGHDHAARRRSAQHLRRRHSTVEEVLKYT